MNGSLKAFTLPVALIIATILLWGPFKLESFFNNLILIYWIGIIVLFAFILQLLQNSLQWKLDSEIRFKPKHYELKLNLSIFTLLGVFISAVRSSSASFMLLSNALWPSIVGFILLFDAIVFIAWANWQFAKQFSRNKNIEAKHELITSGVYQFIRHPRDLGLIIFTVSCALTFNSVISLIFSILYIIITVCRIKDEDDFLENEFGGTWIEYKNNTPALFPFIY
jgi:protein-S-isoprenylcysteine O-methyltransferase Ste14